MRIPFDHGAPAGLAKALAGYEVTDAIDRGWHCISTGELLKVAEEARFRSSANDRQEPSLPAEPLSPEDRYRRAR